MTREHQNYPKSPPKTASSSSQFDPETTQSVMGSQQFASFPLMELDPFSYPDHHQQQHAIPLGVPRPLECLQGNLVPPFLSKTFDLVDDLSLDPIISWGITGQSFVVWDPVEFSRLILPRNFKHNNFSSFVRQLNTYGFRKIDTDRWEFANEAFQRGKKHLLKNIQRRKSPQSQQIASYIGPSTEAGKSGMKEDIEQLRKERSMLMREVVQLQQQNQGTTCHMEVVSERLQAAEHRQKQMVSFLAKLLQNPAFLAQLQQKKEQGEIGSSRMKKKFIKHKPDSSAEEQIVKCSPDWRNLTVPSLVPDLDSIPVEESPDYLLEGMVGIGSSAEVMFPFHVENVASEQVREGTLSLASEDPQFRGKNIMSSQQEVSPEYAVPFPEALVKEKNVREFSSPGIESIVKQEDIWSMGFDVTAGMSSSSNDLWVNLPNYDVPEFGMSSGFSDFGDLTFLQATGGSGSDVWPADEPPLDEPESQAGQQNDDRSKNMDP